MSKPYYKCGHDRGIVIMDSSILSFMEYDEWRTSTGFDGDKTECWECYCKRRNKEIDKFKKGSSN